MKPSSQFLVIGAVALIMILVLLAAVVILMMVPDSTISSIRDGPREDLNIPDTASRSDVELRNLASDFSNIRSGFSTHGFIDVDENTNYVYYHNGYTASSIVRHTNLANFIANAGLTVTILTSSL